MAVVVVFLVVVAVLIAALAIVVRHRDRHEGEPGAPSDGAIDITEVQQEVGERLAESKLRNPGTLPF
ncbi:MAG: hypothetical protein J0H43_03300 [Actinobacteria bacterium]|nr:hypothetical protein [Actinomycetota bacterium]